MKPVQDLLRANYGDVPQAGTIPAELLPYYEEGVSAGASSHRTIDECRYRKQDRIAAWLRGFHDGRAARRPGPRLTDEEIAKGRAGVARLRAALGGETASPEPEPPDPEVELLDAARAVLGYLAHLGYRLTGPAPPARLRRAVDRAMAAVRSPLAGDGEGGSHELR